MSMLSIEAIRDLIRVEVGTPLKELQKSMEGFKNKLEGHDKRMTELEAKVEKLVAANKILEQRVERSEGKGEYLEARSRRNNLLFFGFKDARRETWQQSEEKIKEFLKGQDMPFEFSVERAHRALAPFREGRSRHIRVFFSFFKDKEEVLRQRYKLKGTNIRMDEDLPAEVRHRRNRLRSFALPLCYKQGCRMGLKYPFKEVWVGQKRVPFEEIDEQGGKADARSGRALTSGANVVPLGERRAPVARPALLIGPGPGETTPRKRGRDTEGSPSPILNAPKATKEDPQLTTKQRGPGRPRALEKGVEKNRKMSEFLSQSRKKQSDEGLGMRASQSAEDLFFSPREGSAAGTAVEE